MCIYLYIFLLLLSFIHLTNYDAEKITTTPTTTTISNTKLKNNHNKVNVHKEMAILSTWENRNTSR